VTESLFDIIDRVQSVPRSASGDPVSSERAENKARESGLIKGQALIVLELVKRFSGRTSKELARAVEINQLGSLDRYQIARRLPELESAKLIRRTDEDTESRWWPVTDSHDPNG
jgi:hypothetical protein